MMMIWSRACWTRLFFRVVVVRERDDKNTQDDERHFWVHHHPGKGRGSLQTIQRPLLSPCVQRTSHLKGVVVLVRPHPPREEEEKIVVAVLRATCRSMMMMTVLYNKGFRFVDGRTTTTHDDDDANEWRLYRRHYDVEGSPRPATFSFFRVL